MEKKELERFRKVFTELKKDLIARIERQEQEFYLAAKGDEVDLANANNESTLKLKLKGREQFYLKKINHALSRIKAGTYGECSDCGVDIGIERLHARPTATVCIDCKEEQERSEVHVLYQKKSHTNGKTFTNNLEILNKQGLKRTPEVWMKNLNPEI